jgi:nucleoside-diphosphate-sugar epimerase
MQVFVTGASGVVGRRAVPLLIQAGHTVTAVARNPGKASVLTSAGANVVQVDLFDQPALQRAVAGHEAIVNLATHIPSSRLAMFLPGAWAENDRIRRTGSANLVDAALAGGATRFIQESFAPVYPDRGEAWITEDCPIAPTRYNRTVADAERSAARFTESGRPGVVLRFAGFYGPDALQTLDMIRFVRKGFVPVPSPAKAFISSISHDDAAAAVVAAVTAPAGIYNASDNVPLTRREFFDALAEAIGAPPPKLAPAWLAPLFGSLGRLLARSERISNQKLRALGWAPRYASVREGFPATIEELRRTERLAA